MILDKTQIIKQAKIEMTPVMAKNADLIETALVSALEDLCLRMKPIGLFTNYVDQLSTGTYEKALEGENEDLHSIYAIKVGDGTEKIVADYVEKLQFLNDYDPANATAGVPTKWTIINSSDQFPIVRFNCPAGSDLRLEVYHFKDADPSNIAVARSGVALVTGLLTYAYGRATEQGIAYLASFKELCALSRGGEEYLKRNYHQIVMNREDRAIRQLVNSKRAERD